MHVQLIDHMGSDLSVVNAARVSFAKQVSMMRMRDERLIYYLASHDHWTPFAHTAVTLRIKAPIFVARQLAKHQAGLVWNEVSRRYVDTQPEFHTPEYWRKRAADKKQGSSDEAVDEKGFGSAFASIGRNTITDAVGRLYAHSSDLYSRLIEHDVAPEQARMVLPQAMMTEWWWTGNVASFARVYRLRAAPDAQAEVSWVAHEIGRLIEPLFPVSWRALTHSHDW